MLHTISWKEFFTLMGSGWLFYYGWLLLKYFPYGIGMKAGPGRAMPVLAVKQAWLPAQENVPVQEKPIGAAAERPVALPPALPEERQRLLPELARELDGELGALVEQAGAEKMTRAELIYALQRLLDKEVYGPLRGTLFQQKISEVIVSRLERYCSIRLDAGELSGLWNR